MDDKFKKVLKQDKVTVAVDHANLILKPLGLCVGVVSYIKEDYTDEVSNKYCHIEGRIYTVETALKLKRIKRKGVTQ